MIYFDYSATTPVMKEVLDSYITVTKEFMANAHSIHEEGAKSNELLTHAIEQIANNLDVLPEEIIMTSGATEANNMALKGIAEAYQKQGNHIVLSKLEHPSMYTIADYLATKGFKIDYVNNDNDGLIDFNDLKNKITKETILVSICAVNSELGIRQPLKTIRQIIKKANPDTIFHSDITQALGKVPVNVHDVDLASCSGHKIYGPKGVGMLYKSNKVRLIPLIHGSSKTSSLRAGTPPLPLIVAFSKALRIALHEIDQKEKIVKKQHDKIINALLSLEKVEINATKYSIPHILNISTRGIKAETMVHALARQNIYVSTNTACSGDTISAAILAVYNDKERARSSIRISISHLTANDEVNRLINALQNEYQALMLEGKNHE